MKNLDLNSLMGEFPALQESAEGKLKGGFASINATGVGTTSPGGDVECADNIDCYDNRRCSDNTDCKNNKKCYDNTGCKNLSNDCTPGSTTTAANVVPKQNIGGNAIFSSMMF